MEQPRYWKQLERHPLSALYPDVKGKQWKEFLENVKEEGIVNHRKITLHEGKVLDGWQLQRACVELGIRPNYQPLPKGTSAETFVQTMNDFRRHEDAETIERRVIERRERVAQARKEAKLSTRAIAEQEGISQTQVVRDLQASVEPPGSTQVKKPEENGKIVGRDEKVYPAAKPKVLCDRCERVGETKNCPMCAELRKTGKPKPKPKEEPKEDAPQDAFKNPLPRKLRGAYCDPWIQDTYDFLCKVSADIRLRRLQDGLEKRIKHYPFFKQNKHIDFKDGIGYIVDYLDKMIGWLKEFRPAGVCPACQGQGCKDCHHGGLVPRDLYKTLKEKTRQ